MIYIILFLQDSMVRRDLEQVLKVTVFYQTFPTSVASGTSMSFPDLQS